MKIRIRFFVLALSAFVFVLPLHAALLVVKKTAQGFAPLDASDDHKAIRDILVMYQWPMSAAYALNLPEERRAILAQTGDLFKPNILGGEEIFIEQKIQEKNKNYHVIFIPTTLYELFVIIKTFETDNTTNDTNPLRRAAATVMKKHRAFNIWHIIENLDNLYSTPELCYKAIKDQAKQFNDIFFATTTAHDFVNEELAKQLFTLYPDLKTAANSLAVSEAIKQKSADFTKKLLNTIKTMKFFWIEWNKKYPRQDTVGLTGELYGTLRDNEDGNLLASIITLEYEARAHNKTLLMRGTSFEPFLKVGETTQMIRQGPLLAGTTIVNKKDYETDIKQPDLNKLYTISFGNSLFAGFRDRTAIVYNFLWDKKLQSSNVGYVLFIDKHEYINNQNDNLFFIPPIAIISALFAEGEYFHSRTKPAIAQKNTFKSQQQVQGISGIYIFKQDPISIILIERNPFLQAGLFSEFVAKNGRMIQFSPDQKFENEILKNQQDAATYYFSMAGGKLASIIEPYRIYHSANSRSIARIERKTRSNRPTTTKRSNTKTRTG